jgi:hypothetical protein
MQNYRNLGIALVEIREKRSKKEAPKSVICHYCYSDRPRLISGLLSFKQLESMFYSVHT